MKQVVDIFSSTSPKVLVRALEILSIEYKIKSFKLFPAELQFLAQGFGCEIDGQIFFDELSSLVHLFRTELSQQEYINCLKWISIIQSRDKQDLAMLESGFEEWSKYRLIKLLALPLLTCSSNESVKKYISEFNTVPKGTEADTFNKSLEIELDHHDKVLVPSPDRRNVLITSALPYVNNVPHLGNIIGCVLSADAFARYCRLKEYNTLFVCGTDEYGTTTETKALEEGLDCQSLCDKYHKLHKQVYDWFGIDFDFFGRTTTKAQTEIAQDIFRKCDSNGFLIEDTMTQLYCEQHKSFLADRFVEGICPLCKYPDARGDQCDGCGKLLNASELINPRCKLDNAAPILKDSRHMFLDLEKLQKECESWFEKSSVDGKWTSNGVQITNSWLKEGLKQRCITRDLKWGTPVPKKGYEDKVFYVWFDAPIGYLSITANYTKDWEKWWKNPEQVQCYQFMGKDNVPFHSVIFPCSLLGTRENWTLVNHINTTEYLQYENAKFSKSRGIGVFGNNVMETGIPVEVWRYYLFSVRPESNDSQFTWNGLVACNNNELLANLGNLVNRVVKFVGSKYQSVVPITVESLGEAETRLVESVRASVQQYVEAMELSKLRQALKCLMDVSAAGNAYLQQCKIDNTLFNEHRHQCDTTVTVALNLCWLLGALAYPFIPTTSEAINRQLKVKQRSLQNFDQWFPNEIRKGHVIGPAEYLFKRIDSKKEEEWKQKYGGSCTEQKLEPKPTSKGPAVKTPQVIELEAKIKEQGDKVRALKKEKADAAVVAAQVKTLLALKDQLSKL